MAIFLTVCDERPKEEPLLDLHSPNKLHSSLLLHTAHNVLGPLYFFRKWGVAIIMLSMMVTANGLLLYTTNLF